MIGLFRCRILVYFEKYASMGQPKSLSAIDRQKWIYLSGISGQKPIIPTDLSALEELAKRHLSPEAYAYIAGGAGQGQTIKNNRAGFGKWRIRPSMLNDVSEVNMRISFLGKHYDAPLFLSPVGVLEMAHKDADRAVARACERTGTPYIFSNQASVAMEEVAPLMPNTPKWFQLYWSRSNDLVASLVGRAEDSGCSAIVVTLDTTMLGWRIQDLDLAYLPFLAGKGIAQYTSDPVFQRLVDGYVEELDQDQPPRRLTGQTIKTLLSLMKTYPGTFWNNLRSGRPLKAVRTFTQIYTNPALNWEDLSFLRKQTQLPILLKGILSSQDAQKAVDYGMDGIIVSNHGGRQVDGAVSSIEMLPEVRDTVGPEFPVLLDSGVRCGADMYKAIALGATAVCIGRPYAYGLAIAGEKGVEAVIRNILADFELTMRLSGKRSVQEIISDKLVTD